MASMVLLVPWKGGRHERKGLTRNTPPASPMPSTPKQDEVEPKELGQFLLIGVQCLLL